MDNIIDKSFFVAQLSIPGRNKADVIERLDFFITKYQKEFLLLMLGDDLYQQFADAADTDPLYIDLKKRFVDDDTKQSPIANLVYYWWLRDNVSQTVGLGEVNTKAENSEPVSGSYKAVRAFNEMSLQLRDIHDGIRVAYDLEGYRKQWSKIWAKYGTINLHSV